MDKKTKALKLAFEALKELKAVMPIFPKDGDCLIGYKDRYNAAQYQASNAIAAAKQALEQSEQQQEPDFWYAKVNGVHELISPFKPDEDTYDEGTLVELYKSPPAKPWVDLTENTIINMMPSSIPADYDRALLEFAHAVIEAYKENNT